jgi:antitoxin ParD1/3/4
MTDISLPPDVQAKVDARIESGAESNAIDVVRAALEALERDEATKLAAVRAKIERSLADPRPSVGADEAFDRVEAALAAFTAR